MVTDQAVAIRLVARASRMSGCALVDLRDHLRRYGLRLGEHQFVGLHTEPELPAQDFKAEAALAQRGPEGVSGSICAKVRAVSSSCC